MSEPENTSGAPSDNPEAPPALPAPPPPAKAEEQPSAFELALERAAGHGARFLSARGAWVVTLLTCLHLAYYFPRVVDDLFISLRYAENFAAGHGPVYNLGERVEGYSGASWMFLQSLGFLLRADGVTWTKVLGCVSLLAAQFGVFRITRHMLGVQGWLAWLPGIFLAANSYAVNWAVLGLETPLHLAALVLCPAAIDAWLKAQTSKTRALAVASLVLLGTSRPESPVYLAAYVLAPLFAAGGVAQGKERARVLARVVVPAGAVLVALLALRRGYYGEFLPNTYFVKGANEHFALNRLAPLWAQGAIGTEIALYLPGVAALLYFGRKSAALGPGLAALACMYFTCSVAPDWMPSLRHLLPVTLFAPIGWACIADFGTRRTDQLRVLGIFAPMMTLFAAGAVARVDNRLSPEEAAGRHIWVMMKTTEHWNETVMSFRRQESPQVAKMDAYENGQITPAWGILEASQEPVASSWFVGRDIGAVGYYTGVRVYDTAGLVTSQVSRGPRPSQGMASMQLVRAAMALKPVSGEVYDGWDTALGKNQELLAGYDIRFGTKKEPHGFTAVDRVRPSREEVLRRYEAMAAKMPRWYFVHTLYGESLGAVVERRLRTVRASAPAR